MHDGELWQVFAENGQPIAGKGVVDTAFTHDETLVMGNAHVWMWRKTAERVEILLQKRAMTRSRSPGMYHISAAGHINIGEDAVHAAERETKEELGITIDTSKLYLVHVTRVARHRQSLLHVFTYELQGDEPITFDDGEVDSVKWVDITTFQEMISRPSDHQLIDQGQGYFLPLIEAILWQAA